MQKIIDILSSKKIRIGIFIAFLIIFIIVIFSLMNNNSTEEEQPQEENPTPEKINITTELEEEMTKKIKELQNNYYCDIFSDATAYKNDCMYRKELIKRSDLSEEYRIYSLVLAMNDALEEKNNYIVGNIIVDNFNFTNTQFINYSELEKEYNSLYGDAGDIKVSVVNEMQVFPYIKYDESRKKIYYQTTGGTPNNPTTNQVVNYISNIESDSNNVYVFVSIAYLSQNTDKTYNVYTDRERANLVKSITEDNLKNDQVITTTDFEKFPEYKYTFTKDESNWELAFNQVELVK